MPFSPTSPGLRWILRLTQVSAVSCLIGLAIGATLLSAREASSTPPPSPVSPISAEVERALIAHDCSTDGLPDGAIPGSALIRRASGELRHVSFDRGWAVLNASDSAEILVGVCRAPAPPAD